MWKSLILNLKQTLLSSGFIWFAKVNVVSVFSVVTWSQLDLVWVYQASVTVTINIKFNVSETYKLQHIYDV